MIKAGTRPGHRVSPCIRRPAVPDPPPLKRYFRGPAISSNILAPSVTIRKLDDKFFQLTSGLSHASPPVKKGDLGGFSNGYIKSPLNPPLRKVLYDMGNPFFARTGEPLPGELINPRQETKPLTAAKFKRCRQKLWPSQAAAALALGVTRHAVNHWESGRRPVPETIVKLLECLEKKGQALPGSMPSLPPR